MHRFLTILILAIGFTSSLFAQDKTKKVKLKLSLDQAFISKTQDWRTYKDEIESFNRLHTVGKVKLFPSVSINSDNTWEFTLML